MTFEDAYAAVIEAVGEDGLAALKAAHMTIIPAVDLAGLYADLARATVRAQRLQAQLLARITRSDYAAPITGHLSPLEVVKGPPH